MSNWTRRQFFLTTLAGGVAAGARKLFGGTNGREAIEILTAEQAATAKATRPVIVCSSNGLKWLDKGMEILKSGGDTLDAALAVVNQVEDDPNDNSVGYGGLPNSEGEVELDATVMHGPTRRAGAVSSLRKIKNPSKVAKVVMEQTNHVLLVGEGALRFAVAQGFEAQSLLTERSRLAWLAWKGKTEENWRPGSDSPKWEQKMAAMLDTPEKQALREWIEQVVTYPPTGTIPCFAVNEKGDLSGVVTTSGLAWKIPGRVGDSGVPGAGIFVDGDVGAGGSTGKGEENIKITGGHTIVEMMRQGKHPQEACLEALRRIARNYNNDKTRLATFSILFYAVNKDGAHGGASLWSARRPGGRKPSYAVHDGTSARLVECATLLEGAGG